LWLKLVSLACGFVALEKRGNDAIILAMNRLDEKPEPVTVDLTEAAGDVADDAADGTAGAVADAAVYVAEDAADGAAPVVFTKELRIGPLPVDVKEEDVTGELSRRVRVVRCCVQRFRFRSPAESREEAFAEVEVGSEQDAEWLFRNCDAVAMPSGSGSRPPSDARSRSPPFPKRASPAEPRGLGIGWLLGGATAGSIYESGKGGKGSSGLIYEIDDNTKVNCTKAKYKIDGDCWTPL